MKNLKLAVLSIALVFTTSLFAGVETVVIKTSAQCEMCQEKLETAVGKMDGVKKIMLNIETKELSVKFNDEVVSKAEIVKEINGVGYWADESQPNKEAYAKLDDCCKPKVKSCCASKAGKTSCSKDAASKGTEKACCSGKDAASKKECSHK